MKIHRRIYLLSYAFFLIWGIFYVIFSKSLNHLNPLICSITIASTAFSISDFFYVKSSIEKEEIDDIKYISNISDFLNLYYKEKMSNKYNSDVESIISILESLFEEQEVNDFLDRKLSLNELDSFIDKVKTQGNSRLEDFVNTYYSYNDFSEQDDEKDELIKILRKLIKKSNISEYLATATAICGTTLSFIFLALQFVVDTRVSGILTLIVFLAVVINPFFKEIYKSDTKNFLKEQKEMLIKEYKSNFELKDKND